MYLDQFLVEKVRHSFLTTFGHPATVLSQAPGRINIIGEHIDYNDGFVLPVAIDKYMVAAMAPNLTQSHFRVYAIDVDEMSQFSIDQPLSEPPNWLPYIYGSIMEWLATGHMKGGVDIAFSGNIPKGAGLSSSAALEAVMALGLADLWSVKLDKRNLALHCQKVEHRYAGVYCGIMDQYACVFGKPDHAILLDCNAVTHRYVPLVMDGYSFLLCNSGVTHALASSGYNDRRASCEQAITSIKERFPLVSGWRDLALEQLLELREVMDEVQFRRALHVVREIARVKRAASALQDHDLPELGQLMYLSHEDLRYNYAVSCEELDFLVSLTIPEGAVLGARMMGGGFGGCTLNLISNESIDLFVEKSTQRYREKFGLDLECYKVGSGVGALLI